MSVCHIWFGVARSKYRGLTKLRRAFARSFMRSASCSVFLTVSGLASRKNQRRRPSAIRFTPKKGLIFFISTIFSITGRGRRRPGRGDACWRNPISPSLRYALTQTASELPLTPVSAHTSSALKPSSRCNFTARSFSSKLYRLCRDPRWSPRFTNFSTVSLSSMMTLLVSLECHPIMSRLRVYDLVVSTLILTG
jgi:hypothetical protein